MALNDLLALLYPTSCLMCRKGEVTLCPNCEPLLWSCTDLYRLHGLGLYSALHYNEASAQLILAAKEDNDRAASRYLAELMANRFGRVHREMSRESYLLVPVPSSRAADKRRGYEHMVILAKLAARRISSDYEVRCRVAPVLVPARKVADQSRLTAAQRRENMSGALLLRPGQVRGDGGDEGIILVDDLVTSGSTMGEALRALRAGSYEPDALLSACVAGRFLANKIGR
jgi:ComF family protein